MDISTLLKNETGGTLHLMELQGNAAPGYFSYGIEIPPDGEHKFPASTFTDRNHDYLRTSQIVIFVNGFEFKTTLLPFHFVKYSLIKFHFDDLTLKVMGILPANLIDQVARIQWLDFLGNNDAEAKLIISTKSIDSRFTHAIQINCG